jgi:hypothetical protein
MLVGHDKLIHRIQSIVKVYKVDCVPFNAKIVMTHQGFRPIPTPSPAPAPHRTGLSLRSFLAAIPWLGNPMSRTSR